MKNHNQKILGLSVDKKGLLVNTKTTRNTFWHVHSVELTPYQKKIREKLTLNYQLKFVIRNIINCKNEK